MTSGDAATPRVGHDAWLVAIAAGAAYLVVGRLFALPGEHARAWRLAAWSVSAVVYAAHASWEHFGRRSAPRVTAWHVALGVAIGALGLAVAGLVHSLDTARGVRPLWLVALVAWPAITAIPAFLVTLALATVLGRARGGGRR